jgi:hypothetical protein
MKKTFLSILITSVLLVSCSAFPTAAPTPNIEMTISAEVQSMVAETLTAMPTNTPEPTETPAPTATAIPTETLVPTATSTTDPASLYTPTAWVGTLSPGNTEGLPDALLHIENQTGNPDVLVSLYGVTLTREQPVYYAWIVERMLNVTILWANYNYTVQVPGKGIFQGSWKQNNWDKTTMVISNKGVKITGP